MLACHLPIVAARIGVMPQLLASTPDGLYHADDAADLARAVLVQLTHPQIAQVPIDDWSQLIGRLDGHLRVLVGAHAAPA